MHKKTLSLLFCVCVSSSGTLLSPSLPLYPGVGYLRTSVVLHLLRPSWEGIVDTSLVPGRRWHYNLKT